MKPIIIDYREKACEVPEILKNMDLPISFAQLPVGDYVVGNIIVERKTAEDFVRSLIDGRLHKQLYEMSATAKLSYLVVVGFITEALMLARIPRKTYISALVGASFKRAPVGEQGIVIVNQVETEHDFALFIDRLYNKVKNNEYIRIPPIGTHRFGGEDEIMIAILSAIPNVGSERARRLLERFGNIRAIANATPTMLKRIKGIGDEIAMTIYKFFNKTYSEGGKK